MKSMNKFGHSVMGVGLLALLMSGCAAISQSVRVFEPMVKKWEWSKGKFPVWATDSMKELVEKEGQPDAFLRTEVGASVMTSIVYWKTDKQFSFIDEVACPETPIEDWIKHGLDYAYTQKVIDTDDGTIVIKYDRSGKEIQRMKIGGRRKDR